MFPNKRGLGRLTTPIVHRPNGNSGIADKRSLLLSCFKQFRTTIRVIFVNRKRKNTLFTPKRTVFFSPGRSYWRAVGFPGPVGFWRFWFFLLFLHEYVFYLPGRGGYAALSFLFFYYFFTIIIYSARFAVRPCRALLRRDFPCRRYPAVAGVVDGIYFPYSWANFLLCTPPSWNPVVRPSLQVLTGLVK